VLALRDNNSNVRWNAIEALGVIKEADAVEPLIHLLLNPDEETILRAAAASALGIIGNPQAKAALKAIILRDDFAPIHDTARRALERIEKAD
jgi:HEAT repeat protein